MSRPTLARHGWAIPAVLAVAGVALVLGVAGAFGASSGRRAMEVTAGRRTLELAALSAVEEASGRVESECPLVRHPRKKLGRNPLLAEYPRPETCDATATQAAFAPEGVTLEPVAIHWSDAVREEIVGASGPTLEREVAVLQFEVRLGLKNAGCTIERVVRVRRYVAWEPAGAGVRPHVYPVNTMMEVTED